MEWILLAILFIIIIDYYYSYAKMENFDDAVSTSTTNVTENNTTQPVEPVVVTNESSALGWMSIQSFQKSFRMLTHLTFCMNYVLLCVKQDV